MTGATPPPIKPASTPQRQPLAPSIRATWLGRLRAGDIDTINQLFIGLTIGHGVMFSWLHWLGPGLNPVGIYSNAILVAFLLLVLGANRQQRLSRETSTWLLIGSGYINITIIVVPWRCVVTCAGLVHGAARAGAVYFRS